MVTTTAFFDAATSTISYVVFDSDSLDAVIIDPVLDFEPLSATLSMNSISRLCEYISRNNLNPRLVLDTHVHADHMTGAYYLKNILKIKSAIGENFLLSQSYFAHYFGLTNLESNKPAYDLLFKHNQEYHAGSLLVKTLFTPGHTPSCVSYVIGDNIFCGDALFQPKLGCGRTDFPGGSAHELYNSIKNIIYTQHDKTKLYFGHDYPSAQEDLCIESLLQESKLKNIMLNINTSEEEFITKRTLKDQTLQPPKLLLAAMQINICGGQLPKANDDGQRFFKIPLTLTFPKNLDT